MSKTIWKCTECGGTNVEIKMWVNPNTNEQSDTGGLERSDCWCKDCEEHTELETEEQD